MNTVVVVAVVVLVVVVVDVHQLISDAGGQLGHRFACWTPSAPASRGLNNESRDTIYKRRPIRCRQLQTDSQQVRHTEGTEKLARGLTY